MPDSDAELIAAVRKGDSAAWERLIAEYEGRLQAFARSRLHDEAAAEDVVQEAFLGFLVSLPNYDQATPLESFLFAITAHKLTDALRRIGRRPALTLSAQSASDAGFDPASRQRKASSMARSREHHVIEQTVLGNCLKSLIQSWLSRGEFERLKCVELLFVLGWPNKEVATELAITEQTVANHKSFVVGKLKEAATAAKLRDVDWDKLKLQTT